MKKFQNKANTKSIDTNNIGKLISIFEQNSWEISEDEYTNGIFNDFCKMLNMYNEEQQELILELTKNYLWVGVQNYFQHITSLFKTISEDQSKEHTNIKTIFVIPLVAEKDIGKAKSSISLTYMIKGFVVFLEKMFEGKKIVIQDNYDYIIDNIDKLKKTKILLVDDYVGTGDTAESAILYLEGKGIERKKLTVATLVSQEDGYQKIIGLDVEVYYSKLRKKGISDYYTDENASEMFRVMDTIEEQIGVFPEYKYGYKHSEALVTMTRTPNNTFPVFWLESKRVPVVPFARRG